MKATGSSHAAVSIVNGTATGIGCSLAVRGGVRASWSWEGDSLAWQTPDVDDRVARAVLEHLGGQAPTRGAVASTSSTFPPSRGLKTSSGAAAALLGAALEAAGGAVPRTELVAQAVAISKRAGVTLTGAWDDQAAVVLGGCHICDNTNGTVLTRVAVPPLSVAIWVPERSISKEQAGLVDPSAARGAAQRALAKAQQGAVAEAMTENGAAFLEVYAEAGLPVDQRPVDVLFDAGALGAGLSGTGPAVAGLFASPVEMPHVPGGAWHWTEVVP